MDSRKVVLQETSIIAIGEAIGVGLMFAVFALAGWFDTSVLLGGVVGGVLAIANFFFMALNASIAADRAVEQNVKRGKALIQTSYAARLAVIFIVLFACVKSGMCNVFASVIPLLFVRVTITIEEFFRKPGETKL